MPAPEGRRSLGGKVGGGYGGLGLCNGVTNPFSILGDAMFKGGIAICSPSYAIMSEDFCGLEGEVYDYGGFGGFHGIAK